MSGEALMPLVIRRAALADAAAITPRGSTD
jgi:hypothetical protein